MGAAGLGALAPPALARHDRKTWRRRCDKRCKQNRKTCDQACNILDDDSRDFCKQGCRIGKSQCKANC
jgi:hypothetical protein